MRTASPGWAESKRVAVTFPLSIRTRSRPPGRKIEVTEEQLLVLVQLTGSMLVTNLGSVRKPMMYDEAKALSISGGTIEMNCEFKGATPARTLIGGVGFWLV